MKAGKSQNSNRLSPMFLGLDGLMLLIVFLTMIIPMVNVLALSFSTKLGSMSPGIRLVPDRFTVEGYVDIWQNVQLWRPFVTSVFVTTVSTTLEIILSAMAGYVLIQKDLPLKNLMTSVIMITMMIPGNLTLISIYSLNQSLGLLNSYAGLIINGLISGFSILVIRSYFLSVPDSLAESARIDSAGEFTVFSRIYLPLAIPGIATVSFLEFVGKWNSLMIPVTIITDQRKFTLPVMLKYLIFNNGAESGTHFIAPNDTMAAIVISVAPILLFYVLTQKFLVSGLNIGAVKE